MRTAVATLTMCVLVLPAYAKYSGGTGEPNDPYQIATAADLIALGETPEDYDKHFILTDDIDLDPNLPGRRVFDQAVIAPGWNIAFTGVLDGNRHTISHLTINGEGALGLFGQLGRDDDGREGVVKDLGLAAVNIAGSGSGLGGLVGENYGAVTRCYSTGVVIGTGTWPAGIGGLVGGNNQRGAVTDSWSTAMVSGKAWVGGLVGASGGEVTYCYSAGAVTGTAFGVGGLMGGNDGNLTHCYSRGVVRGAGAPGGLVGENEGNVLDCVWDVEASDVSGSAAGVGLTTAEMMDPYMLGLNGFGNDPNWVLDPGRDYPRLAWERAPGQIIPEPHIDWLEGSGIAEDPYRIVTAPQLILTGRAGILCDAHFVLDADIDLDPNLPNMGLFARAVFPVFTGVFDGNRHTISHLTIEGGSYLGLFGQLGSGGEVKDLGVVDVNITGSGYDVGGLVGRNGSQKTPGGTVTGSCSTGIVSGTGSVGGLVGENDGIVTKSYSDAAVNGTWAGIGGLVGWNAYGAVTNSYAVGAVTGTRGVGGLLGFNDWGTVTKCYSTGRVSGNEYVGGLVGDMRYSGQAYYCFWDMQTSGQTGSAAGTGKTTVEMQRHGTFLAWGTCGDEGIWMIDEGRDYPRLSWEAVPGQPVTGLSYGGGTGTKDDPYLIYTAQQLNSIGLAMCDWDKHFRLMADIDLSGFDGTDGRPIFNMIAPSANRDIGDWFIGVRFTGAFDGNGHTVSHLTINGTGYVGLFGCLGLGGEVRSLGVVDANITGSDHTIGVLVGSNGGKVTQCSSTGRVSGRYSVGGLAGENWGIVTDSYSRAAVVTQEGSAGGVVGHNHSTLSRCYSTGMISGTNQYVGGIVGCNTDWDVMLDSWLNDVLQCFWDTQTSGLATSREGGTGKTTAEMQTASTFLDAGWDFVGETANGTEDIWWILEGQDYPHLWWERGETGQPPVIELDATSFDAEIAAGVVLVDFYAIWCPHCATEAPIVEEVALRVLGRVRVAKLDIDKAPAIAQRYDVAAIPTLILFQDGLAMARFVGESSVEELMAAIDDLLAPDTGPIIIGVVRAKGESDNRAPIGKYDGNTSVLSTQDGGLKDGNLCFSDRTYPWAKTPAQLVGTEYVRTFNSDKKSATVTYTVTTSREATLMITLDDRISDGQAAVDRATARFVPTGTFTDTGLCLFIREDAATDRPIRVFSARLPAGTYVFGPMSSVHNFYTLAAMD